MRRLHATCARHALCAVCICAVVTQARLDELRVSAAAQRHVAAVIEAKIEYMLDPSTPSDTPAGATSDALECTDPPRMPRGPRPADRMLRCRGLSFLSFPLPPALTSHSKADPLLSVPHHASAAAKASTTARAAALATAGPQRAPAVDWRRFELRYTHGGAGDTPRPQLGLPTSASLRPAATAPQRTPRAARVAAPPWAGRPRTVPRLLLGSWTLFPLEDAR